MLFFTPDEVNNVFRSTEKTLLVALLRRGNKVFSVEFPIVCTLGEKQAHAQLGEWQEMVSRAVERTSRVAPTRLDLALRSDLVDLTSLVRLVQREKACCAFFEFTLAINANAVTLVVEVPDEANGVLDEFVASISATQRGSRP